MLFLRKENLACCKSLTKNQFFAKSINVFLSFSLPKTFGFRNPEPNKKNGQNFNSTQIGPL